MSKKHRHSATSVRSPVDLRPRIDRAKSEGRFQQALDLAKQLYKYEPTALHRELLKECYLGRARQLRAGGHTRDAAIVLQAARPLAEGDPGWLARITEELAASGATTEALELAQRIAHAELTSRVLGHIADAAMQKQERGRELVPGEWRADFDHILTAFRHAEAGHDDAARDALQAIGLRSPFLEWKVFLRGLLAYYQHEDARALENWQRLQPERFPARMAAPFRMLIDPAYRNAQAPEAQALLQKQADQLQAPAQAGGLRELQTLLSSTETLGRAFRLAENLLPALRQMAPHLVPRLAACFYWTIASVGHPDDAQRYRRVFGVPADDPGFHRLRALALEHCGDLAIGHRAWQEYERSVGENPSAWPGEQAARVRALVWFHMGQNADRCADAEVAEGLEDFLRPRRRHSSLSPSAEACFQKSLALAPDQRESYEALFHHYLAHKKASKAEKAGGALLKRFPDDVPTLMALGELHMDRGKFAAALKMFERAAGVNPLDRTLREKIATAHLFKARTHAELGEFDAARSDYRAALDPVAQNDNESVYCKWAACEFKAGQPEQAEELLAKAHAQSGNRLSLAYNMLVEAIRLRLPKPLKTRFDKDFNEALAAQPMAQEAAAVAFTASVLRSSGIDYAGQKTHEKKILAYLTRAQSLDFTQEQLGRICKYLAALDAAKVLTSFALLGKKRFPNDPVFYLAEADALAFRGLYSSAGRINELLKNARKLAEALPPDEHRTELFRQIQQREDAMRQSNPFQALFGGFDPFEPAYEILDEDE